MDDQLHKPAVHTPVHSIIIVIILPPHPSSCSLGASSSLVACSSPAWDNRIFLLHVPRMASASLDFSVASCCLFLGRLLFSGVGSHTPCLWVGGFSYYADVCGGTMHRHAHACTILFLRQCVNLGAGDIIGVTSIAQL